MNWRKPLIYLLFYASGSKIPRILREIKKWEFASQEQIDKLNRHKLENLLLHSYNNVPYYHRVLEDSEVVVGGQVRLGSFSKIPLLTKEIIRKESTNLYSRDYKSRKSFQNSSGGSTGEPVMLIQDRHYYEWNVATKLYLNAVLGKDIGDPEIKFWGSERDIIEGSLKIKDKIISFLYNRKLFNSYQLNDQKINQLIALNNRFKPIAYWSYMDAALELANFLSCHEIYFYPPKFLISTIANLTEEVKEKIESQMKCKVYNQYGSREVGPIACQCTAQKELHTFPWYNYVEILDDEGRPVENKEGNIVVTTLQNFSMPLIRYVIGDIATASGYQCVCGRNTLLLETLLGRSEGYFKKADGSLVHAAFIEQALYFRDWIKKFQIIQEEINRVVIKIQLNENSLPSQENMEDVRQKTKILMGQLCKVDFDFVDTIERSPSGKYLVTLCKVQ
ncbi:MAG: phenylacetate--CoA ligase family protein [Deltaproteobacteria bacterium]|nr:phenylacetate--CoA ligase family protein [Deltaproteobacteria bacterium]